MQLTSTLLSWILAHHVGLCSREVLTLKKGRKVNCRWQRAERAFWAWCIFDDQNYSNVLEGQLRSVWYSLQSFFQSFGDDCVSLLQRWMNTVNLFCSLMLCLVLTGSLASGYLPQKFPSTYLTQVHGGLLYLLRSEGKAMWPAETLTHWHHSESLVYYSCCGWVLPLFYFPVKANPCLPACVLCNMRSVTKYMEEKLNFAALLSASRYGFISYADGTVENIIWPRVFYIFSTFLFFLYQTLQRNDSGQSCSDAFCIITCTQCCHKLFLSSFTFFSVPPFCAPSRIILDFIWCSGLPLALSIKSSITQLEIRKLSHEPCASTIGG